MRITELLERNWVFVTNSDFIILISFQLYIIGIRNFKLYILLDQIKFEILIVYTIRLQYIGIENLRLWQRLKNIYEK